MAVRAAPNQPDPELAGYAETCRHYLDAYGAWVHGYPPARHHAIWAGRVSAVMEGRAAKRKLLLVAPPGHAKSSWLSLVAPAWYLGRHPERSLLFFTSSDTNARQFGGTVRSTLEGNARHALTFPDPMCRPDVPRGWSSDGLYLHGTPAASKDPAYRALGYGSAVIGARAHGIVLDDPLAQEQAQSPIEQEKAKRYHDMTVDSRLHPDGWEIGIMTRFHQNDLANFLAKKPEWDVLEMPALGDYPWGPALWPERFPVEWLEAKRQEIGGPLFATLFQGDPSALGGLVFKSGAWFRQLPEDFGRLIARGLTVVQFWDLAYSEQALGDYTVCVTAAGDADLNIYVLGVLRKRLTPAEVEAAMVEQIRFFRPDTVGVEEAAFKALATRDLVERVQGRVMAAVRSVPTGGKDKVTRALLPAARAEAGKLYVDRTAPWWPEFEHELLAFPLGANDDQVDGLSGVSALLSGVGAAWAKAAGPITLVDADRVRAGVPAVGAPRAPSSLLERLREQRRERYRPWLEAAEVAAAAAAADGGGGRGP